MNPISDIQALYGSVRGTWAKSQADLIAHVVLALVVFWICRATIPQAPISSIDPKQLAENDWFKLAKDTGLIYLSFIVPIVLITAYATLLRAGGRLMVFTVMVLFPRSLRRNQSRLLTPYAAELVALTVIPRDFSLTDLQLKTSELALKYQTQGNKQWEPFQRTLNDLTKNAQIYLGDFLLFLVGWIALFNFLPRASWVHANVACFWPVLLVLSALAWFAWFRVSNAIAYANKLLPLYVSMMIRVDPDMKAIMEKPEEERKRVTSRIEDLLREEQQRTESRPSLLGYISFELGLRGIASKHSDWSGYRVFPFPSLYVEGSRFEGNIGRHAQYDREWLTSYMAYLYYRLYERLRSLARSVLVLVRYIVTGAS